MAKKKIPSIAPGIIVSIITINSIEYFPMSLGIFKLKNIHSGSLEFHCEIYFTILLLKMQGFFPTINNTLFCFVNKFIYLFVYFWLHWVFVAACGLSLVVASGGYSLLWCAGSSLRCLLLLWSTGSRHASFSSYGSRAQ